MPDQEPTTEVDLLVKSAIEKITSGAITYDALLDFLAKPAPVPAPPAQPPLPAQITAKEREALDRLDEVYGKVVPTGVRLLEPTEVTQLLDERSVLKTIIEMAAKRVDDGIRTTVLNHNDEQLRTDNDEETVADFDVSKDGHYVVAGKVRGDGSATEQFSVERQNGSVSLSVPALKALADDPEIDWFTHQDFLAMTEQTRVYSPERAMIQLKKKPGLVRAIHEATTRGAPILKVQPRKA
jgi:hypothetical protein